MGQALLYRPFAPGQIGFSFLLAGAAMPLGEREQPFGCVTAAVEHDVFAGFAQFWIEVVIDRDLSGIDDAHIHAGGDGVFEKHRMHRLAHMLVAAEGEREVRHAARDMGVPQVLPDPARRIDEGDAVTIVLLHAGCNREDVRIENNVLRREAHAIDQNVVGARGNLRLAFEGVGLARLIERHHHHGGAVPAHELGVVDESVFALFERDRIHHRFALRAFQTGLDHGEFRGIDHQRDPRDIGLRRDQIEEGRHRLFRIEQALIHIDVEDLRAVLHLIARHRERRGVVAGGDEFAKARRTGDVGAFADIDEGNRRRKRERLEPGKT